MSATSTVLWLLVIGFWAGYAFHAWGRRKDETPSKTPSQNPSHREFVRDVLKAAQELKSSRKFVGDGVSIKRESVWELGSAGSFKVTIEEADEQIP